MQLLLQIFTATEKRARNFVGTMRYDSSTRNQQAPTALHDLVDIRRLSSPLMAPSPNSRAQVASSVELSPQIIPPSKMPVRNMGQLKFDGPKLSERALSALKELHRMKPPLVNTPPERPRFSLVTNSPVTMGSALDDSAYSFETMPGTPGENSLNGDTCVPKRRFASDRQVPLRRDSNSPLAARMGTVMSYPMRNGTSPLSHGRKAPTRRYALPLTSSVKEIVPQDVSIGKDILQPIEPAHWKERCDKCRTPLTDVTNRADYKSQFPSRVNVEVSTSKDKRVMTKRSISSPSCYPGKPQVPLKDRSKSLMAPTRHYSEPMKMEELLEDLEEIRKLFDDVVESKRVSKAASYGEVENDDISAPHLAVDMTMVPGTPKMYRARTALSKLAQRVRGDAMRTSPALPLGLLWLRCSKMRFKKWRLRLGKIVHTSEVGAVLCLFSVDENKEAIVEKCTIIGLSQIRISALAEKEKNGLRAAIPKFRKRSSHTSRFLFEIITVKQRYLLAAESEESRADWVKAIKSKVRASRIWKR